MIYCTELIKNLTLTIVIIIGITACVTDEAAKFAGYPDRSPDLDVLPGFQNPPKGYYLAVGAVGRNGNYRVAG